MALNPAYKKAQLEYLSKQPKGMANATELESYMTSTGIPKFTDEATKKAATEGRLTTAGVVAPGKLDQFTKDIQAGKTGARFIESPVDFAKVDIPTVDGLTKGVTRKQTIAKPVEQPTETATDVRQQLVEKQKQSIADRFKQAFQATKGRLAQEKELLGQEERSQIGATRTSDVMARQAAEKRAAGLGLSGAGAIAQSDIAQNVISQGREAAIRQQAANARVDINRRLTEAQQAMTQGIADAQTEADIVMLQNRLAEIEEAEARAIAQEAQARSDYLTTIGRFGQDFQAEINRIQNDGDPSNDWQIPFLQQARQEKIATQGLDPVTGQPLPTTVTLTQSQALNLWSVTGRATPEIAAALGVQQGDAYSTYAQRIKGAGTTTSTAPNQADVILGYQNLANEFTTQRFDYDTKRVEPVQLSPTEAIAKISQNYNAYVKDYTKQAVDQMISDLQAQANSQQMTDEEYLDYLQTQKKIQELEAGDQSTVEDIPRDILSTLNATFIKPVTNEFGDKIGEEVDNDAMWNAVTQLYLNGNLTAQQADRLEVMYGLTEPPNYLYQGGR